MRGCFLEDSCQKVRHGGWIQDLDHWIGYWNLIERVGATIQLTSRIFSLSSQRKDISQWIFSSHFIVSVFQLLSPGLMSGQEGPGVWCGLGGGDTGRGDSGQSTPDSDNRGPRPGARCQVDRGGWVRSGRPIRGQDQGAISQSEESVTQMNNYHIVQGILWVSNFQVLLGFL